MRNLRGSPMDFLESKAARERVKRGMTACLYGEPTCHGILTRPGCCDACEVDAHANDYRKED